MAKRRLAASGVLRPCAALVELCCDADSELGRQASELGLRSLRITEAERFDTRKGEGLARNFLEQHECADAWSALPCTSWCTWQYISERRLGEKFCSRLAWRRRQSIRMVGAVERCFKAAQANGGAGHFEWPRRCRGWQRPRVQRLVRDCGLHLAHLDGCSVGVMAGPGL